MTSLTELNVINDLTETPTLTLTPVAAGKVKGILTERNLPEHGLRVFVSGGGCSGMQYGMALEGSPREFDTIVEQEGVKLIIDPTSMMYLSGSVIDFIDNLMGGGFKIENPNATTTCGCGHSFRTGSGPAPASSGGGCGSDGCGH